MDQIKTIHTSTMLVVRLLAFFLAFAHIFSRAHVKSVLQIE
jgi:hypothetical protein